MSGEAAGTTASRQAVGPGAPAGFVYEGGWRRFVAALIDNLTWLIAISAALSYIPESAYDESPEVVGVVTLVLLSAWFNYFAISEWKWGQTIGKNAMGMRVISLDRTRPSFGQASIRNLLRLVDFFLIGWVMIAASERKQRLGDKLAKTVVVRVPANAPRHYSAEPVPPSSPSPATTPPPEPGPSRVSWDLSKTIWGLIGGLLVGAVLAPLLVLPFDPELETGAGILAAQALFGASLALFAVGVASGWRSAALGEALSALGLRRVRWSGLGLALLTLFGYYLAAAAFSLIVQPDQEDIAGELGVDDPNLVVAISAVLLIALIAPVTEELFFRGMVFAGLRTRLSLWPAAVISGIVFGLPHVITGPLASIQLAGLGVALAWLYHRTGSLWPSILAHVVNNSLALAVTA